METGDKDEEEIAPTHSDSHEDEVTKLKNKLQELGKRHNNLLNAAKFNSKVAKNKIKELKEKVSNIANLAENLSKEAEKSQQLYKEHIEHTAALAATRKDPGEILKPRQPDPYSGQPERLRGFLTNLRSYQIYYPIQFSSNKARVRHSLSLLKDKAERLIEPIVQDFIMNPPHKQAEITKYVYKKYEHFESELTNAFGIINKKREAEMKIRKLVQKGSAASYLSEYQYQAAKLDWNKAAHMDQVYHGLKPEIKDAIVYLHEKPQNLNDLAKIAVDIDNQQKNARTMQNSYNNDKQLEKKNKHAR
ncbi:hypothetical protein NXS19_011293 [Fusarium pseudograminearum]|nr:hypothetical protein NXS19_011293 [Fusarium pseudograminearum]